MMFEAKQNAITLSAIQLGGALSLPVFMIGYFLGCHGRFELVMIELVLGNSLLLLISLAYFRVIMHYRLVTVDMAKLLFGNMGVMFAGVSMLMSMLGWSVIQFQFMKNACFNVIEPQSEFLNFILQGNTEKINTSFSFMLGFVTVFSVASGLLFDLPTFYRHAKTKIDGCVSLIFIWMMAVLGTETLGLVVAKSQMALTTIDHHPAIFLILILLTGLSTNALNIYSAGMITNRLFKLNLRKGIIGITISSLVLCFIPIGGHLSVLLELMGSSAEAILCMTLSYVFIKGLTLETLPLYQKQINQQFFFATLLVMLCAFVSNNAYLSNIVVNVAVVSLSLMFVYYGVKKHATKNLFE
jgi:cytosine permease